MGYLERRLGRLEQSRSRAGGVGAQVSPEIYNWVREMAREDIVESHADGTEPIFRIAENDQVQTADGRPIRDYRDYIVAMDERIAELEAGNEADPGVYE